MSHYHELLSSNYEKDHQFDRLTAEPNNMTHSLLIFEHAALVVIDFVCESHVNKIIADVFDMRQFI